MISRWLAAVAAISVGGGAFVGVSYAQRVALQQSDNRIENQVAVFAALDKVTARISKLEITLGETVKFGALTITPKVCYTRSPLEAPKTTTFVDVTETQLDGKQKKIFGGWMFAESPGLNAVEHPVYDVWLTDCAKPRNAAVTAPAKGPSGVPARGSQPAATPPPGRTGQTPPAAGGQQPAPAPAPGPAPAPKSWAPTTSGDTTEPTGDINRRRPPR